MMWKCCEGTMAVLHTRCENDRATDWGDQVSLLGSNSADYKVQRNPAYKEATQVRKQNPILRSQRTFRFRHRVPSSASPAKVGHPWIQLLWKWFEAPMAAHYKCCDESNVTDDISDSSSDRSADCGVQVLPVSPTKITRIQKTPSTRMGDGMGDGAKRAKEVTGSRPTCPSTRRNKSGDHPRIGSLPRLRTSFENASVGGYRKKKVPSSRATMSLVDEKEFRGKIAFNRSLSLGMRTGEDNGEPGTASDASSSAKANYASPPALSNRSFGDNVIAKKRGWQKAPKSLNEKGFLVENRIPRLARKIPPYLQLEIYLACEIVGDDAEFGWAFKATIDESGPQPPPSAPTHLRTVWCKV
jgi:hypothetical protein